MFYGQKDKSNYDKVIQYAGEVLGNTPAEVLRDWATIGAKESNNSVRAKAYADVKDRANLLLYSTFSVWARTYGPYKTGSRYTHNVTIASSESCADTPWGNREEFYFRIPSYPAIPKVIMAKMAEYMELTDMTNGIGYLHVMYPALTTDEILLTPAEAYAMKGKYDKPLADLNIWGKSFYESTYDVTVEDIKTFYGTPVYDSKGKLISGMEYYTSKVATPKKRLHPDFTVAAGTQENFIHTILHARRILLLHEGKRWFDIKRYGIEIYRRTVLGSQITITDELKTDDPRRAIQLPQSVINAGMEPNPRN